LVKRAGLSLVGLKVFRRHIVFRDLPGVYFRDVCVGCIFHPADRIGLKELPFLGQFCDALGARLRDVRQSLRVARLAGGIRRSPLLFRCNNSVGVDFLIVSMFHGFLVARGMP
jgi:hypothetical protein